MYMHTSYFVKVQGYLLYGGGGGGGGGGLLLLKIFKIHVFLCFLNILRGVEK